MKLGNLKCNEQRQPQKTTHCVIPFIWNSQNRQIYQIASRLTVSWGWEWLVTINGYGVAFWGYETVVKLTCDDACTNCEYIKNHWVAHFQKGKLYALWIELHLSNFLKNSMHIKKIWTITKTIKIGGKQSNDILHMQSWHFSVLPVLLSECMKIFFFYGGGRDMHQTYNINFLPFQLTWEVWECLT